MYFYYSNPGTDHCAPARPTVDQGSFLKHIQQIRLLKPLCVEIVADNQPGDHFQNG